MANAPNPMKLVTSVARGLAELRDEDLRGNKLNLELEVSVWLRRSGAELTTVPRALLALRRAVLEVAGLDLESEPTPMVVADGQRAVANLCAYLHGLIGRAARSTQRSPSEVVELALGRLNEAAARLSS